MASQSHAAGSQAARPSALAAVLPGVGGLRGLFARAAAENGLPAPRTVRSFERAEPKEESSTGLPAFVTEGLADEQLAQRIDRVLRAEARRQGIDVDGVDS